MRIAALFLVSLALFGVPDKKVDAKLKDVARLQGVRGNQLLGYGVVVGLDGTGDKDQTKFTVQTLTNLMARQGIAVSPTAVKVKNVAAVMVTAELPPFAKPGQRLDVTVSSTGDAKSLAGGTLLMTPLQGADGAVYVVSQGSILVGGFSASAGGSSVTKNHPTVGRIPDGGLVERAIPGTFTDRTSIQYSLQRGGLHHGHPRLQRHQRGTGRSGRARAGCPHHHDRHPQGVRRARRWNWWPGSRTSPSSSSPRPASW